MRRSFSKRRAASSSFSKSAAASTASLERLPDDEQIAERRRRGIGLTRPELAVLLAYSKLWLKDELLASDLPEDEWIATALGRYFPQPLREAYAALMPRHPLRREIIVTHVVNSMVNRVGSTFVHRLTEALGAAPADIVRAYLLSREVFGYVPLWQAIEALDDKVPDAAQAEMLIEAGRLLVRASTWFLRSPRLAEPMAQTIERFRPGVEALYPRLPELLDSPARSALERRSARWREAGVPGELAIRVASLEALFAALDVVELAAATGRAVETVAGVYFRLGARLDLGWLRERIGALAAEGHWQALAKTALRDDLAALQRALAAQVLAEGGADGPEALIAAWEARARVPLERALRRLAELRSAPAPDLAMLSVGLRELRELA
ncbi:MAG: NAD-glutamate dehydrogenase [Burkholderiales bacterium]|nr:NAD-glutamate dehydrogenase [Burkholderiales bacterium]